MWSTWCSVLTRYWMGPWPSTSSRHSTAFVGSCGVSIITGPFDVSTNEGLQPRTRVSVQIRSVTCSMWWVTSGFGARPGDGLLGRGEAAVDPDHLAGDEPRGVRGEEDDGAHEVIGCPDAPHRDPPDDARLERGVAEERRDLRRVDEGRPDGVDTDVVARPLRGPLPGQRLDGPLRGDVRGVPGVDPELGPDGAQVDHGAAGPGRDHGPRGRLRREHRGTHVDLHDPVPRVPRVRLRVEQHLPGAAPDAVDDQVDLP